MCKYELAKIFLDSSKDCSIISSKINDFAKLYFIIANNLDISKNRIETKLECYQISAEYFSKEKNWKNYCLVQLCHCRFLKDLNFLDKSYEIGNEILEFCNLVKPEVDKGYIFVIF